MIVYRHRRNDTNEIFYIGIGKEEKRAYSNNMRNPHWHNIVNKYGYTVEIIANPDTWEEACALEITLIAQYGRRDLDTGNLVNMTDGGEGNRGLVYSDEHRAKISEVKKGNTNMLGKKHSDKTKARMSEAKKGNTNFLGKKHSEKSKQKISEAQRGSKSHNSRLTEEQVYAIKYGHKNLLQKEIAFIYGIDISTVSYIRSNKRWKHI